MILFWISSLTGYSFLQVYIAYRIFKLTKSILKPLLFLGLICYISFYLFDFEQLLKNGQEWLATDPFTTISQQLSLFIDSVVHAINGLLAK